MVEDRAVGSAGESPLGQWGAQAVAAQALQAGAVVLADGRPPLYRFAGEIPPACVQREAVLAGAQSGERIFHDDATGGARRTQSEEELRLWILVEIAGSKPLDISVLRAPPVASSWKIRSPDCPAPAGCRALRA